MVENHIHYQLDAVFVQAVGESLVFGVGAVTGVHLVKIRNRVAVVRVGGHIVFEQRIDPHACNAEVFQVVNVVADALDVAAVSSVGVGIVGLFQHSRHIVVVGVAVGKTVGHKHIEQVLVRKTTAALCALLDFVGNCGLALFRRAVLQENFKFFGLTDLEIQEQIIAVSHALLAHEGGVSGVDCSLVTTDVVAINEQLQAIVLETRIPKFRLHF